MDLTVKHEAGHNMRVKFDWFTAAKDEPKAGEDKLKALEWAENDAG